MYFTLEPFTFTLQDFERKFRVHYPSSEYVVKEYDGYIFRSFQSISIVTPSTNFRIDTLALPYRTEHQLHINYGNFHDVNEILTTIGLNVANHSY